MNNAIYNINEYQFNQTDILLFDANIWLYIYGRQGERSPKLRATYTLALRRIRSVKARIFLDVLVLSEFINAYARFVYNELPQATKPKDFKAFRNTDTFKPVAAAIIRKLNKILEKTERTDSGFESVDLLPILRDYGAGSVDFNDRLLVELCKAKDLKLVTHDADFKDSNLTILTANSKLLM